jgi:CRP-like cAMP-binding protein
MTMNTSAQPNSKHPVPWHNNRLLRGLPLRKRELLAEIIVQVSEQSSSAIFARGDEAQRIYLVESGVVGVTLPLPGILATSEPLAIGHVYPGEFFGWSALVEPHTYSHGAVALADFRGVAFDRGPLGRLLEADETLRATIYQNVARIIAERLRCLEALLGREFRRSITREIELATGHRPEQSL